MAGAAERVVGAAADDAPPRAERQQRTMRALVMIVRTIDHYVRTRSPTLSLPQRRSRRRHTERARAEAARCSPGASARVGRGRFRRSCPLAGSAPAAERRHRSPAGSRATGGHPRRRLPGRLYAGQRYLDRAHRARARRHVLVSPPAVEPAQDQGLRRRGLRAGLLRREPQPHGPLVRLGHLRKPRARAPVPPQHQPLVKIERRRGAS